jgi:hypothetical protein
MTCPVPVARRYRLRGARRTIHAGKTAAVAPRMITSEIHRYKASTQAKEVTPCPE